MGNKISESIMHDAAPRLAQVFGIRYRLRRKYPGKVLVKTGAGTADEHMHEGELADVMTYTIPPQPERVTAAGLGCEPSQVRVLPRHVLLEVKALEAKAKRLYKRRSKLIAAAWHGSSLLNMDTARKITAEREKLEAKP